MLKLILVKHKVRVQTGFNWLNIRPRGGKQLRVFVKTGQLFIGIMIIIRSNKLPIFIIHHPSFHLPINVSGLYVNFNVMVANLINHKLVLPNNLIPAAYILMKLLFLNAVLFSCKIIVISVTS
jgi:hypothetical protein